MQDLVAAWQELLGRYSTSADAAGVGAELLAAWSEPHRRYHAVGHLREILARVEELADDADDADAVRLAAWYHDAVYRGQPDDEERSALRAQDDLARLGLAPPLVAEVARLIRMTVTHDPAADDRNGQVLSDADLASLAVPADRYVSNTAAIRTEYAHVPDEIFRNGRLRVLMKLLGGAGVFRTVRARRLWEAAAQENLRAELKGLSD